MAGEYTEENIKSLMWQEHIRARAGMYIGKLGMGVWLMMARTFCSKK